ncbi:YetF domain-containing protein [Bacillus sp. V2I10]
MLLRMQNVWSVEEVKLGILESNGTISAQKK